MLGYVAGAVCTRRHQASISCDKRSRWRMRDRPAVGQRSGETLEPAEDETGTEAFPSGVQTRSPDYSHPQTTASKAVTDPAMFRARQQRRQ